MRPDKQPVLDFLAEPTPPVWCAAAEDNLPLLLIDHANCEKKAASTALALMYRYVDRSPLLRRMSRLAREELRHFEQVLDVMETHDIHYDQLSASRYAGELHLHVRKQEPHRLIDQLILGAVVEARSCERFLSLMDADLPPAVTQLYGQLVDSEARHFMDYLELAEQVAEQFELQDMDDRVATFLAADAELVTRTDAQFRFHSGVPG